MGCVICMHLARQRCAAPYRDFVDVSLVFGKCSYFGCSCVSDGKNVANCAKLNPVASKTHARLDVLIQRGWPQRVLYLLRLKVVGSSPDIFANREQEIWKFSATLQIPPHNSLCVMKNSFVKTRFIISLSRFLSTNSTTNRKRCPKTGVFYYFFIPPRIALPSKTFEIVLAVVIIRCMKNFTYYIFCF